MISNYFWTNWQQLTGRRLLRPLMATLNSWPRFSIVLSLLEMHAPLKHRKITSHHTPWITIEIKNLMKEHDLAKKRSEKDASYWSDNKKLLNKVTAEFVPGYRNTTITLLMKTKTIRKLCGKQELQFHCNSKHHFWRHKTNSPSKISEAFWFFGKPKERNRSQGDTSTDFRANGQRKEKLRPSEDDGRDSQWNCSGTAYLENRQSKKMCLLSRSQEEKCCWRISRFTTRRDTHFYWLMHDRPHACVAMGLHGNEKSQLELRNYACTKIF